MLSFIFWFLLRSLYDYMATLDKIPLLFFKRSFNFYIVILQEWFELFSLVNKIILTYEKLKSNKETSVTENM